MRRIALTVSVLSLLSACATATTGSTQEVGIHTDGAGHARCVLMNGAGSWTVNAPGAVLVTGSIKPLRVTCDGDDGSRGYVEAPVRLNGPTVGNIPFGGPLGALLDVSTGAASRYDDTVFVHMSR